MLSVLQVAWDSRAYLKLRSHVPLKFASQLQLREFSVFASKRCCFLLGRFIFLNKFHNPKNSGFFLFLLIFYCFLLKYGTRKIKENMKSGSLYSTSKFRNKAEHELTLNAELCVCVNIYLCECMFLSIYICGSVQPKNDLLTSLSNDSMRQLKRHGALDIQTKKTKDCFTCHQEEMRWGNQRVTRHQALHIQILQFLKLFVKLNFSPLLILIMIALSISKTLFIFKALYEHYLIN